MLTGLLIVIPVVVIASIIVIFTMSPKKEVATPCTFRPEDFPSVESISGIKRCRTIEGYRQFRWYDASTNRTLQKFSDITLAPTYIDTCNQWCNTLQLPSTCTIKTNNFMTCENELKPTCPIPSMPVARYKDEYVFVVARGRSNCF